MVQLTVSTECPKCGKFHFKIIKQDDVGWDAYGITFCKIKCECGELLKITLDKLK